MNDLSAPSTPVHEVVTGPSPVLRRTVLTSAAWAVPALTAFAVSPAFATSGSGRVSTLTAPDGQVPAAGAVSLTATVVNADGSPAAGEAITFTGPSGATFWPTAATTDSSGTASTTLDLANQWAKPGSSVTITAMSGGGNLSRSFTVLGSNALGFGDLFGTNPNQTKLAFPSPVTKIAAGTNWDSTSNWFFVALLQNGQVWTYGSNNAGQLGDGTKTDRASWAPVPGLSDITQIAVGTQCVSALASDGTVSKWGDDPYRPTTVPTTLDGLTGVSQIASARATVFALLSDGSVKAWGSGQNGCAGIGGGWPGTTPTQVNGLASGVVQIAAGALSGYARMSDGTLRAWGWNAYGQLGDGSTTQRDSPVTVSTLTGSASQIAAQPFGLLVVRTDGSVVSCGFNANGESANGTTTSTSANPSLSPASLSNPVKIAGGTYNGYALMADKTARSWGDNDFGALGDGTTTASAVPVTVAAAIPADRSIVDIMISSVGSRTGFVVIDTP